MDRDNIKQIIGTEYYVKTTNSEHGEFFYEAEFKARGKEKDFNEIKIENSFKKGSFYNDCDIRFVCEDKKVSICVETKTDYKKSKKTLQKAKEQLNAYMIYEKKYSGNIVVGILASTNNDEILMYKDSVDDNNLLDFKEVVPMEHICKLVCSVKKNSKEDVMTATYALNELLHSFGIEAKIRGQLVGTCLLALKNNLDYETRDGNARTTESVLADIKVKLGKLLDGSSNKDIKITLLDKNVLENEKVKNLSSDNLYEILKTIKDDILPFIDDETTAGQDILNLFFTMFNKYVDKDDKNQAFTPDHITDFMCKITGVDYNSRVLDPCCGSGAFLVRALVTARNSCSNLLNRDELINGINKEKIYGIEYSEKPYGLSTTNMLIHGDGNTNIIMANCFDKKDWIMNTVRPSVVLMNPPYNAQQINFPEKIIDHVENVVNGKGKNQKQIKKEDPTKGLCFVEYISDCLHEANIVGTKLAVLLPLQCAIGDSGLILVAKENILKYNTLEAVFTLPPEMFHPGASVNACCMLFTMGVPHCNTEGKPKKKTFFGYYKEDGFVKKKNLGRVEVLDKQNNSIWATKIEPKWLELFNNGEVESGLSAKEYVTASDEWLCEAYMKTDYSKLTAADFQKTLNDYLSYLVKEGKVYES